MVELYRGAKGSSRGLTFIPLKDPLRKRLLVGLSACFNPQRPKPIPTETPQRLGTGTVAPQLYVFHTV